MSVLFTRILSAIKGKFLNLSSVIYSRTCINEMWILKNSSELLQKMISFHYPKITSIQTFDFSTLYTLIPLLVNGDGTFFTTEETSAGKKYDETLICQAIDFLIDNIYIKIGNHLFQQCGSISMGTNFASLWLICFCTQMRLNFYDLWTLATTPRLDLMTRFRSACSRGKTFSIFCLIFIRWSYLFPLYCSCRRFYRNSETTVQQEHQRSTTTFKIMEEEKSLHGLY